MASQRLIESLLDNTKYLNVDIDGIATGTTRTLTFPNADVDLRSCLGAQALTSAAAVTMDLSSGGYATLTAATNVTLTISNGQIGLVYRLAFTQDATGGRTLTLANGTLHNGLVDTTANATTYLDIVFNGTNYDVSSASDDLTNYYTKAETDALFQAGAFKDAVEVATTGPLTLASDFENGDTVDGYTLVTGDRILVKDQAAGAENGIYIVNATGAPTRAVDFDADADVVNGAATYIKQGTANGSTGWLMNVDAPVVGTTALTFVQYSATTTPNASETVAGIAEFATVAEMTTGTDTARSINVANLATYNNTLIGNAIGQADLDTFTGAIISDNGSVKAGMQELETALEARTLANQAEQTAAFTAAIGSKYNVDTAGGAVTVTLPAGAALLDGQRIQFKDTAGTWDTNNLTIAPNGADNINGVNASQVIPDEYGVVTMEWDQDNSTWLLTKELPSYAGTTPNATETVLGISELATDAEMAAASVAANGGTGGPLIPKAYQVAVHMNTAGTQYALRGTALSAINTGWSTANRDTARKTLDATSSTHENTTYVLANLVQELIDKGFISA